MDPYSDAAPGSSDPPPAYEATPKVAAGSEQSEQTLAYGPTRPFQPAPPAPGSFHASSLPPPRHPSTASSSHHGQGASTHAYQPPSHSSSQPFWNGSNLSPQQTGYVHHPPVASSSPYQPPQQYQPYITTSPAPTPVTRPPQSQPSTAVTYAPSDTLVPGQPLLNKGHLLVYPTGHTCWKCDNTGYKSNDPYHPCRGCWSKYGKPYTGALRMAPSAVPSRNFQRPLRSIVSRPPVIPVQNNGYPGTSSAYARPNGGNVMVVQPGDARIGGWLCNQCGGRGLIQTGGFFFSDTETCYRCGGSGRVF